MSRRAIAAALAVYFLVTLAFGFILELVRPLADGQTAPALIVNALETAFSAFIIPGLLPLVAWGCGRFRAEKAAGSLFVWGVLALGYMILAGLGSFWDQKLQINPADENIVQLDGSTHATLVRSIDSGCVANQKGREAHGVGITNQQITTFCQCFANALASEVTATEIMEITRTGKPSASFQQKANKVSPTCIRIALRQ
jgi:hypothetical protein